ncbi:MAG: hypothetical protein ACP5N7_01920 [Candidatus Pacearchaeota archaeon]
MNKYERKSGRYNNCPRTEEGLLNLIGVQWNEFKFKNGRYPTSQEVDTDKNMIPTRTIQRKLGGLKQLREKLGSDVTNFSSGTTRSETAKHCIARSLKEEIDLSNFLYNKFGKRPYVIKQETYNEISQTRSDIGVYYKKGHFFVDTFFAKDRYSLMGSINHKQRKVRGMKIKDTIFYVSTNDELINQEVIDQLLSQKKNKLPENIRVITMENFKKQCDSYTPL